MEALPGLESGGVWTLRWFFFGPSWKFWTGHVYDDTGGDVGVGEREGNTTIYCTLGTWVWKVNVKDYASKALLEYGSIIVLPIGTS